MKSAISFILILLFVTVFAVSCAQNESRLQDGYYTAEAAEFDDFGWKEFVTVFVNNGKIVTVEYNAKNASGFIKSWDMDYMRTMNAADGTYPNEYTRYYASQFLDLQSSDGVDAMTGATHSYHTFLQLADAVIAKAAVGDTTVALVEFAQE